jgi:hypothetical protein
MASAIAFATVRRTTYSLAPANNTVQLPSLADLAGRPVSVLGTVRSAENGYDRTRVRVRVPAAGTPAGYRHKPSGTVSGAVEVIVWTVGAVV